MKSNKSFLSPFVNPRYNLLSLLVYSAVLVAVLVTVMLSWKNRVIAGLLQTPFPKVQIAQERKLDDATAYRQEYDFTENWFTYNIPVWEAALEPFKGRQDISYLEIGAFEGRSVLWMLENILTHPTSRATVVDIFDGPLKDRYLANIRLSGSEEKVKTIIGFSQVELRKLPLESFDIIYIDGSHEEDDVLEDAVLSWRLLKDGGVLIFDDYQWLQAHAVGRKALPKNAIDPFMQCFEDHIEVIHNSYQMILRKKS